MKDMDTWGTSDMICPFCGAIVDSTDYDGTDDTGTCNECGKTFHLLIEYTENYTTSKTGITSR